MKKITLFIGLSLTLFLLGCLASEPQKMQTKRSQIPLSATLEEIIADHNMVLVPAGSFEMGDHSGKGGEDPKHPSDEKPIHTVTLDAFFLGKYPVTTQEYCDVLDFALSQGLVEVRRGLAYLTGRDEKLFETSDGDVQSRIKWDGKSFSVLNNREDHPMTCIYWEGAAAFCNWMNLKHGYDQHIDLITGKFDITKTGFRLPTEAEWEYAGRGGQYNPYYVFPWGNDENKDGTLANWPESNDPYETGPVPHTTPVGFYDGSLRKKEDYNWPGEQQTYQTRDGSNPYGLYDMSGNVWEWVMDWYMHNYYATGPKNNPPGPETGRKMPDGMPYHVVRGGQWYNGQYWWGHSRTANRNPSYYRGNSKIFDHHGLRLLLDVE
jgi:formylglycine-generating enzyme required for sulfatase activity